MRSAPKNVGSMKCVRLRAMFFFENGHRAVMPPVVDTSKRRWLRSPARQIGITVRSVVVGSRMKNVYPVAIASEASSAARIECMGPRWVRKTASRLRIERASMSKLTLDTIRISWRFVSNRKAWPRMKPKSACENTSIRSSPFCNGIC